jgi:hypothetical protein
LTLNAIFNEGEYADKVVARALKKDKRWGLWQKICRRNHLRSSAVETIIRHTK